MRILYIVQHFAGPSGFSGSRAYENARRLVQMGHEVTLMCGTSEMNSPQDAEDARRAGLEFHQAPLVYRQAYSYAKRMLVFRSYMKWAVEKGKELPKPDLVFASSTPLTVGEIGRQVAGYHGVPFVFEVRDLWPEVAVAVGALKNPVLRLMSYRMARRIYSAVDHVVALSQGMKDGIKAWEIPDQQITVIPNCSDTALFGSRQERESKRRELGWEGKLVCVHPGAMGLVNNLDYLLDCAKSLEQMGATDIEIALIGDGAMKPHLSRRIAEEKIKLASLYDPFPKREVPTLLSAADVGLVTVLPMKCMELNSSNKFFDFLAASLPIVLNYGGWQEDVLRESGAGLSADPRDASTMAAALTKLRDDPERVRAMGTAARQLAETRFDRDALAAQLESILVEVVRSKSGSGGSLV